MSHKYVSERISQILNNNNLKIINCHLGQGASICAIKDGKSQDISMGSSPVAGIPMGTRAGDLDPSIVTFLMKKENLSADEMNQILNKESGVAGMSGVSNDFRDIEKASSEGNERAKVTIDVFCYKVSQFIMDYIVALDGVDVITFTAGIGENQSEIRKQILNNLSFLGVKVDDTANATRGEEIKITTEDSKIQAWVIPTNEEYMIAQDTINLL
jgi:acetate kinase